MMKRGHMYTESMRGEERRKQREESTCASTFERPPFDSHFSSS